MLSCALSSLAPWVLWDMPRSKPAVDRKPFPALQIPFLLPVFTCLTEAAFFFFCFKVKVIFLILQETSALWKTQKSAEEITHSPISLREPQLAFCSTYFFKKQQ